MMTPIQQASGYVSAIHRALTSREDCDYSPILQPTALELLGKREEELRYNAQFGWDEQLPSIAERLVPLFKSAWTRQNKAPIQVDVRDDPSLLRIISTGCRGLVQLGNRGHFRDPDQTLVFVLNQLVMHLDDRQHLLSQCMQLRLKPLQP